MVLTAGCRVEEGGRRTREGSRQEAGGSSAAGQKGWDVICAKASPSLRSRSVNIPIVPTSRIPIAPRGWRWTVVGGQREVDGR